MDGAVRHEGEGKLDADEQAQHAGRVCGDSPGLVRRKAQRGEQRQECKARWQQYRGDSAQ